MTEVLPGIHQLKLPMTGSPLRWINGYLLKADDGWVLVDCGWNLPDVIEAFQGYLAELAVDPQDVRTLVITHYHPDHFGMSGTVVSLTRARLLMHRLDWLFVDRDLRDFEGAVERMTAWLRENGTPDDVIDAEPHRADEMSRRFNFAQPDELIEDGHRLKVGKHEFEFVWTPGHTGGHVCLYDRDRAVLLSGDHVLDPITPNVSLNRGGLGNPMGDYIASLRKVGQLEADLVLPAHGEPFRGLTRRIDELLAHHDERESEVMEALAGGSKTGAAVAAALPWTRRKRHFSELASSQQRMAITETLAHLEELVARGRVSSGRCDGLIVYTAVSA
ncbi:MAG: MBL fold metallo-hydrolase [Chloroflexota bacterium]